MSDAKPKSYSVDEIRKMHAKAYAPWTGQEDKELKSAYKDLLTSGKPSGPFIAEYAKKFGRKSGGIRSRIKKLLEGDTTSYKSPRKTTKASHVKTKIQFQGDITLPDYLSADQKLVLEALLLWIQNPKNGYITVGGYAGTGKTTITSILRTVLEKLSPKLRVSFACFTGKASMVLKSKLIDQKAILGTDTIGTIHSLMYKPKIDSKGRIISWKKVEKIESDLIIIDEASMLTKDMWKDLLSYKIPIIAIGDHGQLPPVGDTYSLMQKPELRLETIHRHRDGNPILEVATLARTTGKIPFKTFSPYVKKLARNSQEAEDLILSIFGSVDENTLILCGRNNTRIRLNNQIRQIMEI
ncbi:MAG: AAA family ATPase, partial [Candidatus Roizmanbacteria bacterium]